MKESPFFLASCGCIGVHIGDNKWVTVKHCCSQHDEPQFYFGQQALFFDKEKTYTPLTEEETKALLSILSHLIVQGHNLHDVANLFGGKLPKPQYEFHVVHPVKEDGKTDYGNYKIEITKN